MVDINDEMLPIESYLREEKIEITSLKDREFWNKRKVGLFKRKASGKIYPSPRIIFDSQYKDFIGKHFSTFVGRATYKLALFGKEIERFQGDCMILFFRDDWNKEKNSRKDLKQ